jgi:hypothetical protein
MRRLIILAGLLCTLAVPGFSQEDAVPQEPTSSLVSFGLATGETLLTNFAVYELNVLLFNPYWRHDDSFPATIETIKRNLNPNTKWIYDSNGMYINQLGHPYQGTFFHAAGRANGFTFYQSLGFDMLGAATWEIFAETDFPAVNDFISSSFGGAALGEMLHRLHREVARFNPFLAIPFSPIDSLNNVITRKGASYRNVDSNIYSLAATVGANWFHAARYAGSSHDLRDSWNTAVPELGLQIIYGNPFEQESTVPYEHFEWTVTAGLNPGAYFLEFVSDGYLFSFQPIDTPQSQASTGLTLHWDVLYGENENFSATSLDWTFKLRRTLQKDWTFELKAHAGWSGFASTYLYRDDSRDDWEQNYSTGVNSKLFLTLAHTTWGTLSLRAMAHELFVFPNTMPDSGGSTFVAFFDADYTLPLTKHFSIRIGDSFSLEHGRYDHFSDVDRWNNSVKLKLVAYGKR